MLAWPTSAGAVMSTATMVQTTPQSAGHANRPTTWSSADADPISGPLFLFFFRSFKFSGY